ncbi:hypothetical protein D9M68_424980 [compost metagenome]
MYGKVSRPSVLILFPRFSGVPKVPSALIATLNKSDWPSVPGISDAKYNVFSSMLKAGCAVL